MNKTPLTINWHGDASPMLVLNPGLINRAGEATAIHLGPNALSRLATSLTAQVELLNQRLTPLERGEGEN